MHHKCSNVENMINKENEINKICMLLKNIIFVGN